ncbi:hypothetical protein Hanom_Chr10g00914251 [Helianthus anomalus]
MLTDRTSFVNRSNSIVNRSDSNANRSDRPLDSLGRGKDTDKGHNVHCAIDSDSTNGTVVESMAKFLRESRHVRAFWNTARFDESDKMIHAILRKKDQNGKDIDVSFEFGVGDVRRVLDLQDSEDDPTIMSERLAKGLWCRMGFTSHINGKMTKTSFSKAYRYLVHCMVHSLSHRKGAYDEVSDYIMNIVISLVLNRKYNISQVIFEYMKESNQAKGDKYIMYPRFIIMLINDKIKDLPKIRSDVMDVRNITHETILRVTKEGDAKPKQMICRIKDPKYVAPENEKWRHDNNDSDNEDEKMNGMSEKKTRWWCVKGSSGVPQQRLIDETTIELSVAIEQGVGLLKETFKSYLKKNEEVAAKQDQGSSTHVEKVTRVEPEIEAQGSSREDDSEATQFESELDPTTLGRGKAQLKKKPLKKKKGSGEEDSPYDPEKSKKQRRKRKAVQAGFSPRNVRAKKAGAEPSKEMGGKT